MFITKGSAARGSDAGAETRLGGTRQWARGPYVRRCRFPTDKVSLRGHHTPLSLHEQVRLERWALQP